MENEERGFQELSVSQCSFLSGQIRFPPKDHSTSPQPVVWRNNLTALSQYYNLYFVAYGDKIYVFMPDFPSQSLSAREELILQPPTTQPGLIGYLDPGKPHAINHLIVADLGNEEIVICACDDGDIVAYTTRSIQNNIESRVSRTVPTPICPSDIRPFFMRNVGLSAWGLAVHKEGRMIAVSANTKNITVFAFALGRSVSPDGLEGSGSEDDTDTPLETTDEEASDEGWTSGNVNTQDDRSSNLEIVLVGHKTNIPSIAFCNTADDESGRYLVSTDINGEVLIWDIWKRIGLFRHSLSSTPEVWNNVTGPRTCGWGVLCLDPRSFRLTKGRMETFGCHPDFTRGKWDISESRGLIKDTSGWRLGFSMNYPAPRGLGAYDDDDEEILADYQEEEEDDDEDEEDEQEDDEEEEAGDTEDQDEDYSGSTSPVSRSDDSEASVNAVVSQAYGNPSIAAVTEQAERLPALPSLSHADHHERPDRARKPLVQTIPCTSPPSIQRLPFSIFHTSETEIYFFQDPLAKATVTMMDPLNQKLPPNMGWLSRFDRMNMVTQIPELGIVIAASPVGRVALFTMTRTKGAKLCASRLDWILPFYSQEKQGLRPRAPLLGIAVGPIQGRQFRNKGVDGGSSDDVGRESWRTVEFSRRYRLMLTYCDHSVLSYELGRSENRHGVKNNVRNELLVF